MTMPYEKDDTSSRARDVFWVIGTGTDVGKTTIVVALIRLLNRVGIPTVGFKPIARTHFRDAIDFLLSKCPRSNGQLFGSDGYEIAMASPLTDISMADVVSPCLNLSYPGWRNIFLSRTGSKILDNVAFFRTEHALELNERLDFQYLAEKIFLPLHQASITTNDNTLISENETALKMSSALNFLIGLGAERLVFEGANYALPVWEGSPAANHVFVLSDTHLHFYRQANIDTRKLEISNAKPWGNLQEQLSLCEKKITIPYLLFAAEDREQGLENMLHNLLVDVGYL